jgi:hypothetical protein
MAEDKLNTFLNIVSVFVIVIGAFGIFAKPQGVAFTLAGIFSLGVYFFLIEKFKRLESNEERILLLEEKLSLDERFSSIEKELAEQKGKLSMVVKK